MKSHYPTMKERLAADRAANAERRPYCAIAFARALGIIGLLAVIVTGIAMIFGTSAASANPSPDPREAHCSTGSRGRNAVAIGDGRPAQGSFYAGRCLVLRASDTGCEPIVIDAMPSAQRKL